MRERKIRKILIEGIEMIDLVREGVVLPDNIGSWIARELERVAQPDEDELLSIIEGARMGDRDSLLDILPMMIDLLNGARDEC